MTTMFPSAANNREGVDRSGMKTVEDHVDNIVDMLQNTHIQRDQLLDRAMNDLSMKFQEKFSFSKEEGDDLVNKVITRKMNDIKISCPLSSNQQQQQQGNRPPMSPIQQPMNPPPVSQNNGQFNARGRSPLKNQVVDNVLRRISPRRPHTSRSRSPFGGRLNRNTQYNRMAEDGTTAVPLPQHSEAPSTQHQQQQAQINTNSIPAAGMQQQQQQNQQQQNQQFNFNQPANGGFSVGTSPAKKVKSPGRRNRHGGGFPRNPHQKPKTPTMFTSPPANGMDISLLKSPPTPDSQTGFTGRLSPQVLGSTSTFNVGVGTTNVPAPAVPAAAAAATAASNPPTTGSPKKQRTVEEPPIRRKKVKAKKPGVKQTSSTILLTSHINSRFEHDVR